MGGAANIRALNRSEQKRKAKLLGCPQLGDQSRSRTKHANGRLAKRFKTSYISFTGRFIRNLIQRRQATIEDAEGCLSRVKFVHNNIRYVVIVELRGKKVIKIITVYQG